VRLESDGRAVVVREDVAGAPARVGQWVLVDSADEDATVDERFEACVGVVTGFFYDDLAAQFPARPLVVVHVDGLGEELFFPDELRVGEAGARLPAGRGAQA
jgi:hypothetical protein